MNGWKTKTTADTAGFIPDWWSPASPKQASARHNSFSKGQCQQQKNISTHAHKTFLLVMKSKEMY